jgi:hypothetical protein
VKEAMGKSSWSSLFWMAVIIYFVLTFEAPDWAVKMWYSIEYNVPYDRVQTEKEPEDCNFLTAPLGSKGCSYTRTAIAVNELGQEVPSHLRRSNDTKTGKPIVSADDGKTWWFEDARDWKAKTVYVSWIKK